MPQIPPMAEPRHLLAIETSSQTGSVALIQAGQLIAEKQIPTTQRTARSLHPTLKALLNGAAVSNHQLGAVAVTSGPGSFTGLRIGVTTAKTLAYAIGCQVVSVNTLDVLAAQADKEHSGSRVWAVIDAQRGDLFAACYDTLRSANWGKCDPTQLLSGDAWLGHLQCGDVVVGHAAVRYADLLPSGVVMAEHAHCVPTAATVGFIGSQMLKQGVVSEPFQLTPRYHRPSAAEEKHGMEKHRI
ncbi:MAG: tRNA (adenosine(37)-N6)-threonylcarbamoyltransferase complex dimerization subunit type 1 TsaB [Aeoliella sp.]